MMTPRSLKSLGLAALLGGAAFVAACSVGGEDEVSGSTASAAGSCGSANQACCAEPGTEPCAAGLGCSSGVCKDIETDVVAYANYCKRELQFADPEAKLPYMSCFDSEDEHGNRVPTGRQAQITLSVREGGSVQQLRLADRETDGHGHDVWDHVFGADGVTRKGCDDPNYLYGICDPYYRLNVWQADPKGNQDIVAALHCRDGSEQKPIPSSAISAAARREAFESAQTATDTEKRRLFNQWNGSSEIVLTLTNTRSGKACFFHAKQPYYGSHIPAPDNVTDTATAQGQQTVWNELPVKPPYAQSEHRDEWLRNAGTAWQQPNYMRCTNCHDSGPFMHDPFIDSMGILPEDRKTRPYIPLGYQARYPVKFIKTDRVRNPSTGETSGQRCTSCHSMGSDHACGSWFDRALGWEFPTAASTESRSDQSLARYMPDGHGLTSSVDFYEEYGASVDAMKCCCEHNDWGGCHVTTGTDPTGAGVAGTEARSCTESTCGAHNQACCETGPECNHGGLQCRSGTCKFKDE